MKAKFQRGDGKGHTNWIDGSMVAIVPPEYQFYLGKLDDFKYVESGHKKMAKGYLLKNSSNMLKDKKIKDRVSYVKHSN